MSQTDQAYIEPHVLSRYDIIKKIGSGAYGIVWKVEEKATKKVYALKKIFDAFQHSTDAQRTYREIQILRQIDHPNIVKLYQKFRAENNKDVYLVFQFLEADLHNVIAEGILKQVHVRFIVYQLAKALKYLHSGSLIHRDLKPSNILVNSNCTIKLCDFGLVRSLIAKDESPPVLTEGVATRWYRAPQILLGSTRYSTPADIWSFGCIIYQILAQKPMFPGENTTDQIHKILSHTGYPSEEEIKNLKSQVAKQMLRESKVPIYPQNQKALLKDLPKGFADLIRKMTALNPQHRITVQEILNDEVVAQFRKKQQEIECSKVIMTQINDNRKLTVDEYRKLVYGVKRSYSTGNTETKVDFGTKKSSSYSRLATLTEPNTIGMDKHTLKYTKPKQFSKLIHFNKSKQLKDYEKDEKKIEEKVLDVKKETFKEPSRMNYISQTTYTPKYGQMRQIPNVNQSYSGIAQQSHYAQNNSYSGLTYVGQHNKIGSSYTSSSAYTNQRKPILFKSSKYVITKSENSIKQ